MNIQDDHFDLLLARVVFHRDMLTEDLKRTQEDRYFLRTVSSLGPEPDQRDRMMIKLYQMTLPQLTRWFETNCIRDPPETIIGIEKLTQ